MSLHVDEMTSEVVAEPEAAPAPRQEGPGESAWEEEERFRSLRERIARDRLRTAADGFDD